MHVLAGSPDFDIAIGQEKHMFKAINVVHAERFRCVQEIDLRNHHSCLTDSKDRGLYLACAQPPLVQYNHC